MTFPSNDSKVNVHRRRTDRSQSELSTIAQSESSTGFGKTSKRAGRFKFQLIGCHQWSVCDVSSSLHGRSKLRSGFFFFVRRKLRIPLDYRREGSKQEKYGEVKRDIDATIKVLAASSRKTPKIFRPKKWTLQIGDAFEATAFKSGCEIDKLKTRL